MEKEKQRGIIKAFFEESSEFANNKVRFSPLTAIIGENLSGKSRLMEEISKVLINPDELNNVVIEKTEHTQFGGMICEREPLSEQEKRLARLVISIAQRRRKPLKKSVQQAGKELGLKAEKLEQFSSRFFEAINLFGLQIPLTSHKGDFTQSISVQLIVKYALFLRPGIPVFFVEEPEMHLHPQGQMHLRKVLTKFSDHAQILMTTHSPYMLVGLPWHSLVKVNPPQIEPRIRQIPKDFISRKTEFPRRLNAELAATLFARVVLLVEGETEKISIPIFAKKILQAQKADAEDLTELGVQILSINGNNFKPYLHLFSHQGFNIPWVILTDNDSADNLFRALKGISKEFSGKPPGRRLMRSILQKHNCFVMQEDFEKDFLYRTPNLVELIIKKYFPEDWKLIKARARSVKESRALMLRVMRRNKPRFAQFLASEARIDEIPRAIKRTIESVHTMAIAKTSPPDPN